MKNRFALLFAFSFLALSILTTLASRGRSADSPQSVAAQIIAREKASVDAWGSQGLGVLRRLYDRRRHLLQPHGSILTFHPLSE